MSGAPSRARRRSPRRRGAPRRRPGQRPQAPSPAGSWGCSSTGSASVLCDGGLGRAGLCDGAPSPPRAAGRVSGRLRVGGGSGSADRRRRAGPGSAGAAPAAGSEAGGSSWGACSGPRRKNMNLAKNPRRWGARGGAPRRAAARRAPRRGLVGGLLSELAGNGRLRAGERVLARLGRNGLGGRGRLGLRRAQSSAASGSGSGATGTARAAAPSGVSAARSGQAGSAAGPRARSVLRGRELLADAERDARAPAGGLDEDRPGRSAVPPTRPSPRARTRVMRISPSSPRWRARASGSLSSAQSSGGDFTSVRCTSEEIIGSSFRSIGA